MKCVLHLANISREFDARAAGAHLDIGEAARGEPVGDSLDVGIGGTELFAELIGRQPLVIVGRAFVLLLIEQLAERGFLFVAALESERHVRRGLRIGDRTAIELRTRHRMHVALEREAIALIDRLCDASGNSRRLRRSRGRFGLRTGHRVRGCLRGNARQRKRQ